MTGDFILSSAYGITPTSANEPYIQRSNNLVVLVYETNQRDAYIGSKAKHTTPCCQIIHTFVPQPTFSLGSGLFPVGFPEHRSNGLL